MKIILYRFFAILITLFGTMDALAVPGGNGPPAPSNYNTPPPSPIDENLFVLLVMAILFGVFVIYKHNIKTKASISK